MKDRIKVKLDEIDRLFPKERIDKSKERWRRLWAGEPVLDRLPFNTSNIFAPMYDPILDMDAYLDQLLDECVYQGRADSDRIPSLCAGCRQGTIPGMFGAREVIAGAHGEDYSNERIIRDSSDIDRLPEPELKGAAKYWLEIQEHYLNETGGRIPIHVADMQGPVDVAGKLWGYEKLWIAACTEPESYHKLLEKTTRAFLTLWNAQMDAIGKDLFVGTHLTLSDWVPLSAGASVSVDSMVMISEGFFEEFFTPYLEAIGDATGGYTVHSCGNFSNVMRAIGRGRGARGVHASEMSVASLVEAGIDTGLVMITYADAGGAEGMFRFIRDNGLKAAPSINVWPQNERAGKPWLWTEGDWDTARETCERVKGFTYA